MTQKAFLPSRCGCQYQENVDGYHLALVMCPMHTAAPDLLAGVREAKGWLDSSLTAFNPLTARGNVERAREILSAAIAKASPQAR